MKLQLDQNPGLELVTAQGNGFIEIRGRRHERSVVVFGEQIIETWNVASFAALEAEHFAQLAELGAAVTLIGTGQCQRFPSPALLRPLIEAGRGFEIMDTAAACRTYNLLAAEGRQVCAALIIEKR